MWSVPLWIFNLNPIESLRSVRTLGPSSSHCTIGRSRQAHPPRRRIAAPSCTACLIFPHQGHGGIEWSKGCKSGVCGQWLLPRRRTRSSTQSRAGRPTHRRRRSRFHAHLFPTTRTVRSDPAAPFSDNATYPANFCPTLTDHKGHGIMQAQLMPIRPANSRVRKPVPTVCGRPEAMPRMPVRHS
jgi:hypothetical protein